MKKLARVALLGGCVLLVAIASGRSHAAPQVGPAGTAAPVPVKPGPSAIATRFAQPRVVAVRAIADRTYGDGGWPYEADVLNPTNTPVQVTIDQDPNTGGFVVIVPPTSTKTVTIASALGPLRCKTLDYPITLREYRANDRVVRRTPSCTFKAKLPTAQNMAPPVANKVSYRNVSVSTSTPTCNQPFRAEADIANTTSHAVAIELLFGPATPRTFATIPAGTTQRISAGLDAYAGTIHDPETAQLQLTSSSSPGDVVPGGYKVTVDAECHPSWVLLP